MRRKTNIQSLNSTYQTNVKQYCLIYLFRKQCAGQVGYFRKEPLPIIVIKSQSTHLSHKTGTLMQIFYAVQGQRLLTSTLLGAVLAKFSILHENSYLSQILNS
jgi:hypothetical protein